MTTTTLKPFYKCPECGFITDDKSQGCLACMGTELKSIGEFETIEKAMASHGCDDCCYLRAHRCKLWQVKVSEPYESSCESWNHAARVA